MFHKHIILHTTNHQITEQTSWNDQDSRNYQTGAGIAQLVVCDAALRVLTSSEPPMEGIFPLELTWFLTPFTKNSFG